jgi:TonB family protein
MSNSFLTSVFIHTGLLVLILMLPAAVINQKTPEPIIIEVVDAEPRPKKVVESARSQIESVDSKPVEKQAAKSQTVQSKVLKTQSDNPVMKTSVSKNSNTVRPVSALSESSKPQVSNSAPKGNTQEATLEDIEANDLDYDSVLANTQGSLKGDELDSEFNEIDKNSNEALNQTKKSFENDLKSLSADVEDQLSSSEIAAQQEANALAKKLAERSKALKAGVQQNQVGGSGQAGENSVGSSRGTVRSIENLRQMNGNPKPQYSIDERFKKQQGTVVFQAFVTDDGFLKDFKLMQSTGYKNLDGKTLAVLKKWRFYPGQKGWVEIPQTWNLKGESEQMPTMLRRKISQR